VIDDALHGKETANFEFVLFTKDTNRVEASPQTSTLNLTPYYRNQKY
jgi:hypothetical protein